MLQRKWQSVCRLGRVLRLGLALSFAIHGAGDLLQAQNATTGEIRGTTLDPSGAILVGVQISAVEGATQFGKTVTSDAAGTYLLDFLPPGYYTVTFDLSGFRRLSRTDIIVASGDVIRFNPHMEVGSETQSVTVSSEALHLETESPARSSTFTSQAISELPNVGRNNQEFLMLIPGASYGDQRAGGGGPGGDRISISGQRTYTTNFTVDGGAGTFPQSYNADNVKPSLDSTEEIAISTNNFSAEYGNGGAVFSVITKSGTNRFHGTLYEFNQNDAFNALNYFATTKPPVRWNQFGGNLGGPILRNKMFFFFAYEGLRSKTPSTAITTVPTAAMRAGDFSATGLPTIYDPATTTTLNGVSTRAAFPGNIIPQNRLDSVALAAAQYWPMPNRPGLLNNYNYSASSTSNEDLYTGKLDYNITPANRLTGSVVRASLLSQSIGNYPGAACNCGSTPKSEWQAAITDVWTITPALLNELRLSFLREHVPNSPTAAANGIPEKIGLKNVPNNNFPTFTITGYISTALTDPTGFNLRQNVYMPTDNLTWVHGKHIVKVGAALQKLQVNNQQPWYMAGSFTFAGVFTENPQASAGGLGMADYLLGLPQTYLLNPAPDIGERNWNVQLFAQDDYKLFPTLTLSAGLRYMVRSGWSEAHNQLSNFNPNLLNPATGTLGAVWYAGENGQTALTNAKADLFAPRVGLAWSPFAQTAVRAGYGIFFVPLSADTYSNQNPAGFAINESVTSTDLLTPIFSLSQGPPAATVPTAADRTASFLNGHAISYWPTSFVEPYSQQWYLGVQQALGSTMIMEVAYLGSKGTHLVFPRDLNQVPQSALGPGNAQLKRPYPQYQGITTNFSDAYSNYSALQIVFRKVVSKGLMFSGNYTYSKNIDDSSYDHTTGRGSLYQIAGQPNLMRANSQLDLPHRVSGLFVYQLPIGRGRALAIRNPVLDAVVGGWQTSGIFTAESGIPYTVTMSGTNLSNSLAGTWLPNRLGSGKLPKNQQTLNHWFDPTAFATPATYTYGNSERNILFGPVFWDFDSSLAKNFVLRFLGEQGSLQLRGDFSNVLNHPNFNTPNSAIGASNVGTITGASSPRAAQISLKLKF